ncbi:MAG: glycosyltransferase family 2 protein [Fuerstiella sp.]
MIEAVCSTIWILWVSFTAIAAGNVWLYLWQLTTQDRKYQQSTNNDQPQVAVITCIKGFDPEQTPVFLRSLCDQNYSKYRLIFAFEDDEERALEWIQTHLLNSVPRSDSSGPRSCSIVIAGFATLQGQKVHNQLAAFETLVAEDQIIAFADADIQCAPDWLAKLTSPITKDRFQVASGGRLPVPIDASLPTLTATSLLNSVVTLASFDSLNITWGGSMAISRQAFEQVDLPSVLSGCLNDDVRLAVKTRQKGFPVGRRLSLMVASPIRLNWPGFWEFSTRQYYQIKKYSPFTFLLGIYPTFLYTLGFLSACVALALGNNNALIALLLVAGFDQLRAFGRSRIFAACVDPQNVKFKWRMIIMQHALTPFWMAVHACIIIKAIPQRSITWGGITYQVIRQNRIRILNDPRQHRPSDDQRAA